MTIPLSQELRGRHKARPAGSSHQGARFISMAQSQSLTKLTFPRQHSAAPLVFGKLFPELSRQKYRRILVSLRLWGSLPPPGDRHSLADVCACSASGAEFPATPTPAARPTLLLSVGRGRVGEDGSAEHVSMCLEQRGRHPRSSEFLQADGGGQRAPPGGQAGDMALGSRGWGGQPVCRSSWAPFSNSCWCRRILLWEAYYPPCKHKNGHFFFLKGNFQLFLTLERKKREGK